MPGTSMRTRRGMRTSLSVGAPSLRAAVLQDLTPPCCNCLRVCQGAGELAPAPPAISICAGLRNAWASVSGNPRRAEYVALVYRGLILPFLKEVQFRRGTALVLPPPHRTFKVAGPLCSRQRVLCAARLLPPDLGRTPRPSAWFRATQLFSMLKLIRRPTVMAPLRILSFYLEGI